jgi:hypothetical protein
MQCIIPTPNQILVKNIEHNSIVYPDKQMCFEPVIITELVSIFFSLPQVGIRIFNVL